MPIVGQSGLATSSLEVKRIIQFMREFWTISHVRIDSVAK